MTGISVLIPAKNEANNIERCLRAVVGWATEVVVVDSQSTDGTIEIVNTGVAQTAAAGYTIPARGKAVDGDLVSGFQGFHPFTDLRYSTDGLMTHQGS